jgi:hypothetical protein
MGFTDLAVDAGLRCMFSQKIGLSWRILPFFEENGIIVVDWADENDSSRLLAAD